MAHRTQDGKYLEMHVLYMTGLSMAEVGRDYGMRPNTVREGFMIRGFHIRSKSQSAILRHYKP